MDPIKKFTLTEEHKEAMKKAMSDMVDKQFEVFAANYDNLFKQLPYAMMENMSEAQASDFVSLVVKEAVEGLQRSAEAVSRETSRVINDPEKMEKVRQSFMDKLGIKPTDSDEEIATRMQEAGSEGGKVFSETLKNLKPSKVVDE